MKPPLLLNGGMMSQLNNCKGCGEYLPIWSLGYCKRCYKRIDLVALVEQYQDTKAKVKPTYFQAFIFSKIKDQNFKTLYIPLRNVKELFSRSHIPSTLHYKFIEDMESCGLLKKANKRTIKILK